MRLEIFLSLTNSMFVEREIDCLNKLIDGLNIWYFLLSWHAVRISQPY